MTATNSDRGAARSLRVEIGASACARTRARDRARERRRARGDLAGEGFGGLTGFGGGGGGGDGGDGDDARFRRTTEGDKRVYRGKA